MMDVSGSMGTMKKYLARSFYFWMTSFLRVIYKRVEIRFIAHTTEARLVDEYEFLHRGESGGTSCHSAYELATDLIDTEYPTSSGMFTPSIFPTAKTGTWTGPSSRLKRCSTGESQISDTANSRPNTPLRSSWKRTGRKWGWKANSRKPFLLSGHAGPVPGDGSDNQGQVRHLPRPADISPFGETGDWLTL